MGKHNRNEKLERQTTGLDTDGAATDSRLRVPAYLAAKQAKKRPETLADTEDKK